MKTEGTNKLISEFMKSDSLPHRYDTSWDWLMPVWKKIMDWGVSEFGYRFCQEISQDAVRIYTVKTKESENPNILIPAFQGSFEIDDVYQAAVEFIKWYNKYLIHALNQTKEG